MVRTGDSGWAARLKTSVTLPSLGAYTSSFSSLNLLMGSNKSLGPSGGGDRRRCIRSSGYSCSLLPGVVIHAAAKPGGPLGSTTAHLMTLPIYSHPSKIAQNQEEQKPSQSSDRVAYPEPQRIRDRSQGHSQALHSP